MVFLKCYSQWNSSWVWGKSRRLERLYLLRGSQNVPGNRFLGKLYAGKFRRICNNPSPTQVGLSIDLSHQSNSLALKTPKVIFFSTLFYVTKKIKLCPGRQTKIMTYLSYRKLPSLFILYSKPILQIARVWTRIL